jgi:hypothetical protein
MFYEYGVALVAQKALENAGPHPTRSALLAGINKIKNYNDQIVPPVTWGTGTVVGVQAAWPEKCCNADNLWVGTGPAKASFT